LDRDGQGPLELDVVKGSCSSWHAEMWFNFEPVSILATGKAVNVRRLGASLLLAQSYQGRIDLQWPWE
jgi:hypothetical protein